jgi:CRP-like cAMP-binding protein
MSEKIRKLKEDASRLIAKGKLDEACDCYEKVVKADTRDLTARQKLAEIYARLGKTERAVHVYQSVAGSYAADGLLLKAIAVCKIILQIDPSHTETQTILADLSTKRRGPVEEHTVVEMPKAMSEALAGKKSASSIRGVAANQIRGVSAQEVRPAIVDDVPVADEMVLEQRPAHTNIADLQRAAAAMLPAPEVVPVVAGKALPDDISIDISFDDAEPVVVGTAHERPSLAGAPILTAAINAALPSFDELMAETPGPEYDEQPSPVLGAIVDDVGGAGVVEADPDDVDIDDSNDDDDVIDLDDGDVQSAQVDVERIPPIPLFSDLPRDAFVALTERMDLRVASTGETLITENEPGSSMFIIIQGKVKVLRHLNGADVVLAQLSDGTFFGEMALLSDVPRAASVVCTEETMLFEISRELLAQMTTQYPSVGEVMQKFHKNRLITNLLKTSPIFAPFSTNDKKALIEKFKSREVGEGSYLITREKPGDGLYVVLSGRCAVLDKDAATDVEVPIAELREGDVFGEMSMLWNKETCASVRATTTCTVLRLPKSSFGEVIMTHPQILETLSTMSEQRQRANSHMHSAGVASEFLL